MSDDEKQVQKEVQTSSLSDYDEQSEYQEPPQGETLHRGLKARQISMIALGGAVGTGLIIGSGTALRRGGPLGILLGYMYVGLVCYLVMVSLGEMAAFLPHKKGFAGYATRFADPALGFALGWNYLFKYLIVTPNNINAAGVVIQYWTRSVHIAIWMTIFIVAICLVNFLGVRVFGELEFWFSSIKVLALIGLLLMGIIIDLGGNPKHDRLGFRYWRGSYGPMGKYLLDQVKDTSLSIFLGFWATLTNALFAYIGTELIGVTAENPRKNIPIAIRRTFFRILVFYVGGVFVIGLIVPSTDRSLFVATSAKTGAAASPFVVATTLVGIRVLNHIVNAAILVFVMSAANSDLYIGSRTLYGLAIEGKAPTLFKKVNRMGVPWPSLLLCTAFCALVYLNVEASSAKVFGWFVNLVSTFGALTWMSILYSHIRFMKALTAHGMSRDDLPYKAPMQPWGAWFALISTIIITIFKGFDTFLPWNTANFITTKLIPYKEVDLVTGIRAIEEEERQYLEEKASQNTVIVTYAHDVIGYWPNGSVQSWNDDKQPTWPTTLKGHLLKLLVMWKRTLLLITLATGSLSCSNLAYILQSPLLPQEQVDFASLNMSLSSVSRSVVKRVFAAETPEGAGARVRRSIGSMTLRNLSPFLMLDHFHVGEGAGFPDHPHRGQATVTYMLEGSSRHEDSAGHKGTIDQGGVQWMCAGRGIIHAEMPVHAKGKPDPRGLQLWVDLPKQFKMVEPSYQELGPDQIPTAFPEGPDGPVQVKVISGKSHGVESPVRPLGGCWYFHFTFKGRGTMPHLLSATGWTAFIYLWKGAITVGDETMPNPTFHTLILSAEDGQTGVKLTAGEDGAEFVLAAAEPLDQTVFQYGPFVMTTREEIQKTLLDYQMGMNGFEKAHTWKSEIGNQ
ncbi:hypothetical protein NP233_g2089 [Leucocoprinus birnbaumii]|uniref:Dicarboxylic amino acid permease n=1 Tax=Leucocoprinus birnbaumii TaxID=56174 RepID=A0AAD5VYV2_9AGAR|nr:hypothetical protein NP233_g2089 [Leucocoprinus birnbaumii]